MSRILSVAGTLLVLAGVAMLAYVGITYATAAPHRSVQGAAPRAHKVAQVAIRSVRNQQVAVPRRQRTVSISGSTGPAVRMVIPKINLDAKVVQTAPIDGVWDVADWSVGHLTSTPDPGVAGNGAYAAHDDIKGEIFKRENELKAGDSIYLFSRHAVYRYVVTEQLTVDPSNVGVLAPTARPTITLVSCTPYWVDTQRLIVHAVLKSRRAL